MLIQPIERLAQWLGWSVLSLLTVCIGAGCSHAPELSGKRCDFAPVESLDLTDLRPKFAGTSDDLFKPKMQEIEGEWLLIGSYWKNDQGREFKDFDPNGVRGPFRGVHFMTKASEEIRFQVTFDIEAEELLKGAISSGNLSFGATPTFTLGNGPFPVQLDARQYVESIQSKRSYGSDLSNLSGKLSSYDGVYQVGLLQPGNFLLLKFNDNSYFVLKRKSCANAR